MNELDEKIRSILQEATDSVPLDDDPTLVGEIIELFNGRNRQLMKLAALKLVIAGLLFYFCIYMYFQQEALKELLAYAAGAICALVIASVTILYLWQQMNHNTTLRELKRLELQINLLAGSKS